MPLARLTTLIGGLLLSRGGRRMAGRHAGKLALAALAFRLWKQRQAGQDAASAPGRSPHPRRRWSGRRF